MSPPESVGIGPYPNAIPPAMSPTAATHATDMPSSAMTDEYLDSTMRARPTGRTSR